MKIKLIIITAVILIVGIIGCIFILNKKSDHPIAQIYQDDKIIEEIDLAEVDKEYTMRIDGKDGAYNIVSVRNGEIAIIEASCPDKVCVHMGYIKNGTLPITCLPNHVIVKIQSNEDSDVDVVTK